MSSCSRNCETCGVENCESREIKKLNPHKNTSIKKIIAITSGKGGVGKSLVTSLTAVALAKKGYKVAIMDADVTGPSIPKAFNLTDLMATQDETAIYPEVSKTGIKVMSVNLLLEDNESPIIWRGPLVAGFVQQLFTEVDYGELDYLLIDMPPGTGDIPLTVFQSLPIDGIVVVSSPQDLVSMVVAKSVNMAKMMYIPIIGLVMNMSYVKCPDCGKIIRLFGDGDYSKITRKFGLELLAELPLDPNLSHLVDEGKIENYDVENLSNLVSKLEN